MVNQHISNNIEIVENDIDFYFQEYCEKYKIDDMKKENQNVFNACLMYIAKNLFKGTGIFKYNPNINNEYDISKLNILCDYYIEMCGTYGKEVSLHGFAKLSAIDTSTFFKWGANSSCEGFHLYKRICEENENSNNDLLSSGKNPVGIIARLNHRHNWNMPGVTKEIVKPSLNSDSLPQLIDSTHDVPQK